jgi:spermidine synthase
MPACSACCRAGAHAGVAELKPVPALQISEERGIRYLHFGSRWVQGAMRMSRPDHLELEYTREMMLPLLLRAGTSWPARALLIGLGAGSLAKFLYRHRPQTAITVVEVRQDVVDTCGQFFKLPDDPARLSIELDDGAIYVASTGPRFDLVLVDGYDAKGRVGALDTPGFYRNCRARMRNDAMLATNLLTRHRGVDASLSRMREAFCDRAFALPACASGNVIALAARGAPVDMSAASLEARATEFRNQTGLNLSPTVTRLVRASSQVGVCW